jgi:hypothetical protein
LLKEKAMARKTLTPFALAVVLMTLSACSVLLMGQGRSKRPAESEFGTGPRTSARGLYVATLEGATDLKARKMYTIHVTIADGANGQPVSNATIAVDGGMPEHGHGLPTRPRITKSLGNGAYELSGLRFNMGGWWELKLTIDTPDGVDTVTFNVAV